MFARCVRLTVFFVMFAALGTGGGTAAEIRMTDGQVYYGITIARRDAVSLECFGPRGRMLLPVYQIAQIDGVRMIDVPENAFPYVASLGEPARTLATPPPTAPVRRNVPVATATPPPRPLLRTPPPVPAAAPTVDSPGHRDAHGPGPGDTRGLAPGGHHAVLEKIPWRWLAALVVVVLWALSVVRVRRDARRAPVANARFWLIVAIVLPVVGYLLYELARIIKQWWRSRRMVIQHRREFIFPRCRPSPRSSSRPASNPPASKTPRTCSRTRSSTAPATCTSNPARPNAACASASTG